MALLLSFTLGAVAQNVASTATSVDALTDGYYVICAKSNDGKATASYLYAESNKVYYDATGSEKALAGSAIDANTSKYMFYVSKNSDGTLKISLWNDHNTSWPTISDASATTIFGGAGSTPGRQDQFTMNSTTGALTASASSDGYILSLASHYYKRGNKNCTGYVVLNNSQHVGYYDWQKDSYDNEDAIAKVNFYAVSGTPLTTPVNITYNLKHNETTLYTETHSSAFADVSYPDFSTNLNKYYLTAEKPSGTISATDGDKTFDIELAQQELPFTCGDAAYYYLGTAGENPVMIYNKSGMAYRTKTQASTLNDIYNDLWTIRGNVFDGFQFTNVSAGNLAHSSTAIVGTYGGVVSANLAFSGAADNTYTWDICRGTNGFMIYPHGNESSNRYWSYNGSNVKFNNDDNTIKEFAFYAPEFTFPMYTVGDASYNSIALTFPAQLAEGENTKMYKGKVNGSNLDLTEVSAVPASAGVVLVGPANAETATFVAVKSANEIDDNDLVGTTVAIANADLSDKFIFGVADDDASLVGFFTANSEATLNANHAYILRTTAANVKGLAISFNGTPTGITLPTNNTEADAATPLYDLSGRRVTNTIKGHLYIKAGRKFIAE